MDTDCPDCGHAQWKHPVDPEDSGCIQEDIIYRDFQTPIRRSCLCMRLRSDFGGDQA